MTPFLRRLTLPGLACLLAACQSGPGSGTPPQQAEVAAAVATPAWRSSAGAQVEVGPAGVPTRVRTGPHSVVWDASRPLRPPYTVRATLQKQEGRMHEGYGLVFGGSGLDRSEEQQRYSYFLIRGDGSFLIKRRDGRETPVVQPWTSSPAVPRDAEGGATEAMLEIQVGGPEVIFVVDGQEVARVPADRVDTEGYAGVRVSHNIGLAINAWATERNAAGGGK